MAADPFTIRIFVADGDPEGVRLIDRMNWTGFGVVFPREQWAAARQRAELGRTGVYVLVGYKEGRAVQCSQLTLHLDSASSPARAAAYLSWLNVLA